MRMTENLLPFRSEIYTTIRTLHIPIRCIKFSENRAKTVNFRSRHGVSTLSWKCHLSSDAILTYKSNAFCDS